ENQNSKVSDNDLPERADKRTRRRKQWNAPIYLRSQQHLKISRRRLVKEKNDFGFWPQLANSVRGLRSVCGRDGAIHDQLWRVCKQQETMDTRRGSDTTADMIRR